MLTRKNEKGNVLFLILIAVVLFAALSYAVSQSNQTSGDISSEEAELAAAEIINYFAAIQGEAQRLNLVHGVPYYNINLGNNNSHGSLTGGSEGVVGNIWADNPNCVDLDKCSVFIERGGNIPSRDFYELAGIPIGNWNGPVPYLTQHTGKHGKLKVTSPRQAECPAYTRGNVHFNLPKISKPSILPR